MNNFQKSRNIPLTEYYSVLQIEWLSYHIRRKLYRKDFIESYNRICSGKKDKIDGISKKNCLPSIFTDKVYRDKYISQLIPDFGIPNFQYKDKETEAKMKRWDIFYYFSKGTSVKFLEGDNLMMGTVNKNDRNSEVLEIYCFETNSCHYIHYSKVSRIFSEDFFNI